MHLPFLSRPGLARLAAALALALAAGPAPAGLVVRADPDEYLAALLEDFPGIDQPLVSAAAEETPCHHDGSGRTHAIIVGAPFGDQVEGTSNDVGLMREVLLFRGVDADRIHPLSGADATFANLAGQAQAVLDQASCGDSVLIHISAALREAQEEVAIPPEAVEVIGVLPPVDSVTGFQVTPVVGIIPPDLHYHASQDEV